MHQFTSATSNGSSAETSSLTIRPEEYTSHTLLSSRHLGKSNGRWNSKCRLVSRCGLTAVALFCLTFFSESQALVGKDSIMPMDVYTLQRGNIIAIPKGVDKVRGIYMTHSLGAQPGAVGHESSILCHIWKFAFFSVWTDGQTPEQNSSKFQEVLDEAARISKHPEIANAPFTYTSGRWVQTNVVSQIASRCIAIGLFDGLDEALVVPKAPSLRYIYECRREGEIPQLPSTSQRVRAAGVPLCYSPSWGWSRGTWQSGDYLTQLFDWSVNNRIPAGETPADGKVTLRDVKIEDGWLGDPNTWYAEWPQAYPYAEFPRDKSMAPWIPNSYLAAVWKSIVAKDSLLKNNQNPMFGINHMGSHADATWGCSSPPRLGVTSPLSIPNKDPYSPMMVPRDTILNLKVGTSYLENEAIQELQLYEGDRLFATRGPSAYNVWNVPCTLRTPGPRAIILKARLKTNKWVNSWPAIVYVDRLPSGVTDVKGSNTSASAPKAFRIGDVAVRQDGTWALQIDCDEPSVVDIAIRDLRGRTLGSQIRHLQLSAGRQVVSLPAPSLSKEVAVLDVRKGTQRVLTRFVVR